MSRARTDSALDSDLKATLVKRIGKGSQQVDCQDNISSGADNSFNKHSIFLFGHCLQITLMKVGTGIALIFLDLADPLLKRRVDMQTDSCD